MSGKCGVIKVRSACEVEATVQDYDILLCAGKSRMSRRIQRYQRLFCDVSDEAAKISHVAMIKRNWRYSCKSSHIRDGYTEVFESTTLNKWAGKSGSQVNPLFTWLGNYDGDVYLLPLKFERTAEHFRALDKYIKVAQGMPYENGIPGLLELLLCAMPWIKNKPTDSPHCSEQNVRALQAAGLFDADALANKFPPCEFWPGGMFEKHLADGVGVMEPLLIVK